MVYGLPAELFSKEINIMTNSFIPNDPLYSSQWHLSMIGRLGFGSGSTNFAGIERVWADYTGQKINVGIWDDGVQKTHWDLDANYDSSRQVTISGTLNNGQPLSSYDGHGTSVAGLIAAENNGLGGIGEAFNASITAIRIFGGKDDINSAWSRYLLTLDSLGQFDVTNHSYGGEPDFSLSGDVAKFATASISGRHNLGTLNVKSAGNSNVDGNGEALDASRYTVTVAALDNDGQVTSYSTYGAHILVSAPAGSVTTDLLGNNKGYDGLLNGDYTNDFGGTSAAGPITAGVITLMLSANNTLGWRDVQNILAYSAVGTGSISGGITTNENFAWKLNGANNWNGAGLHYSEDYGYGMVNAFNAVRMAEVWSIMNPAAATSSNEILAKTSTFLPGKSIPDLTTTTFAFNVSDNINLEHVALTLKLTHTKFTNLRINLISPDGTSMSLYDGSSGTASTSDYGLTYTFGLDGFRGESSFGTWTLKIQDIIKKDSGTLNSVTFTGYGSTITNNDVYHYTDEALTMLTASGESALLTLADNNEGTDWIDAATMYRNLDLNLNETAISTLAGTDFLTIASGTDIENAITGDGNDTLTGNSMDNILYGMRGEDTMDGGAGNDTLNGGEGIDTAVFQNPWANYTIITTSNGTTVVSDAEGTDQLTNFEFLQFDDQTIADPSINFTPIDSTPPLLETISPGDNTTNFPVDANIVLTFNESIEAGSGYFCIYESDGTLLHTISVTAIEQISISNDTVTINPASNLSYGTNYYLTIDADAIKDLAGNSFAGIVDAMTVTFQTAFNVTIINGTSGADTLNGTTGDDHIYGLAGNDKLNGNAGNDLLDGGSGNDTMTGGTGNDIYIVDSKQDSITENSSAGIDTVQTTLNAYSLGANVENLDYTGILTFTGTGNTLDNVIGGNSRNDTLNGGAGNDTLNGMEGNDYLIGGTGNDALTGSSGSDVFRFDTALNNSTNADTINDFTSGSDKIELENAIFKQLKITGTLVDANFRASNTGLPGDTNDYVLYNNLTGKLYYDADGSGNGASVLFATLIGIPSLTAADCVIT